MNPSFSFVKARLVRWPISLLLILTMLGIPRQVAHAAEWCQCVKYVQYRYALSGGVGTGGAKTMGPYLSARGFVQIYTPKVGAVVILKPAFGRGVNSTYGHVGVIAAVADLGTEWRITVRGANQGGSTSEYNCTNVGNWTLASYSKSFGTTQVEYWTRNFALGRPTWTTSIERSSFEAYRAADGNGATRWSSRITGPASEWWTVDMQAARTFDRVNIRWEAAYARRYFVGWSNNGSNYTGYWISATSAMNVTVLIGVRTARYVGIFMTEKAPGLGNYSFWEVGVYANGSPAALAPADKTMQAAPMGTPTQISIR